MSTPWLLLHWLLASPSHQQPRNWVRKIGRLFSYKKTFSSACTISVLRKYNNTLWWRHNWHDSVSNHQPHDCLLNRLFRRRLKKTSKLRVTGLCAGNSPVPGEFPAQMASNAENVSIWWRIYAITSDGRDISERCQGVHASKQMCRITCSNNPSWPCRLC